MCKSVGDQRPFGFLQAQPEARKVGPVQIDRLGLILDQTLQLGPRMIAGDHGAPAGQAVFQLQQTLVEPGRGQRRRQVRDGYGTGPALGQGCFGGVVGGIEVDVRHLADQPVGPVAGTKAVLLARHEFQRPVHPEVQDHVGAEGITHP
jgi:hypothetical protein